MKIIRLPFVLTLFVITLSEFSLCSIVWAKAEPLGPPVRRALLIGIGKYDVLPHLPGSKNDVAVVQQVLTQKFGFSPQHVQVLTDAAATRDGILTALRELVSSSGPHDVLYVHYSGHGSQVQDFNGDETDDQLDETIVPVNGRTEGIPDITDDELDEIFSTLKTPHAVFVFDSCHSGTVTRGVAVRTRFVPPDTRVGLYRNARVRTRGVVPLLSQRYLLLTGAASNQQALDGPVNGTFHGFFTYSLFRSLMTTAPEAPVREVYRGIQHELGKIKSYLKRRSMPEPQLEGRSSRLDQPLFPLPGASKTAGTGSSSRPRLLWHAVKPMGQGEVRIVEGGEMGTRPGSVWALYPPGETRFVPGEAQAYGLTLSRQGRDVLARLEPKGAVVGDQARAVLFAPAAGSSTLRVQFREVSSNQRAAIEEALNRKLRGVVVVGPDEETEYVIDATGDQVEVLSGDGLEEVAAFPVANTGDLADDLASLLARSLTVNELLRLENPLSQINVVASVVQASKRGVVVVADRPTLEDPTGHIRKRGEPRTSVNSLQLRIQADADCYLTIVDVDAEGGVNVLFPNDYQKLTFYPDGFIQKGVAVMIPDSLASNNQAGFHWDFAEPPGTDTIRIFATTDLQMAQMIREQIKNVTANMMVATRGSGQVVQMAAKGFRALRAELVRTMTRGIVTVPDEALVSPSMEQTERLTEEDPPAVSNAMPFVSSMAPQSFEGPAPDWTAVSVTVRIEP